MAKVGRPVAIGMVKRRTHQHERPRRPIVLLERRAKRGKATCCPRIVKRWKCMAVMNMFHCRAAKDIPNVAERSASRRPAGSIGWHTGKRARVDSVHEGHRGNTQRF